MRGKKSEIFTNKWSFVSNNAIHKKSRYDRKKIFVIKGNIKKETELPEGGIGSVIYRCFTRVKKKK